MDETNGDKINRDETDIAGKNVAENNRTATSKTKTHGTEINWDLK